MRSHLRTSLKFHLLGNPSYIYGLNVQWHTNVNLLRKTFYLEIKQTVKNQREQSLKSFYCLHESELSFRHLYSKEPNAFHEYTGYIYYISSYSSYLSFFGCSEAFFLFSSLI